MNAIVTQMIILFILVVVGYIISKKKMMDADFDRKLSVFVINVACPCLILSSVMGDTLPDKHFIIPLLIVGFATYVILIGAGFLLPYYLPIKAADRGIYSFMLAFGNVGFIGYPIVASIFGASAVFYASILNFPSTLLIFVFGTLFISGDQGKMKFKWNTLYCPAMIASYLSILIVATGWIPPKVISTPLTLLGNMTVPSALLIIGSSIAQIPIRRMLGTPNNLTSARNSFFHIISITAMSYRTNYCQYQCYSGSHARCFLWNTILYTIRKRRNYHGARYIYNNTAISLNDTTSHPFSIKPT